MDNIDKRREEILSILDEELPEIDENDTLDSFEEWNSFIKTEKTPRNVIDISDYR